MSIYQEFIDSDIEVSSWQSDLYVPATPEVLEILNKPEYASIKANARRFISQITWKSTGAKASIELPFQYSPYWQKRSK